jgi:outer membrane lipoprotein SlyB
MRRLALAALIAATALTAGCQRNISANSYAAGSVGQVNRTVRGTIISARPVEIGGTQSGLGAGAGAAAGGLVGSQMGRGSGNALATLGGVIAGGVAGAMIEESNTRQTGMEYVVETENGALLTVVQGSDTILQVGQKALVMYGNRARVVPAY